MTLWYRNMVTALRESTWKFARDRRVHRVNFEKRTSDRRRFPHFPFAHKGANNDCHYWESFVPQIHIYYSSSSGFESDEFLLLSNPQNFVVEQVFSVLFNRDCSGDQSEKSHLLNYAQRSVTETTLQLVHFASRCNYNYGKFERLYVIYSH